MSSRFPNVDWYCDECNEYLNDQPGFTDQNETWTCTACGHGNSISSDAIFTEEEIEQTMDAVIERAAFMDRRKSSG